jgi:site-specific recombinase XerD
MLREMAKQFGGVEFHKSSGRWCIRFRIEGRTHRSFSAPAGKHWIPFRVRENAEDVLDEIRADIRRGIPSIAAIAPYVQRARLHSVERWWDKWIEYQTARAEAGQITTERWRKLAAHLSTGHLDAIRETPIHQLDYATLEDLQRSLFDLKLAPKSVRHVMADVRTFLGWLEDRKLIQAIPKMPKINVPRYIPDIPSPAQQEAILAAIPWDHRGFFLARGYMGMRPREAVRARVEDYRRGAAEDGSDDSLRIRAKGDRDRLVPVDLEVARWVREFRPALAEAGVLLFPSPSGGAWADQTARRWIQKAMKAGCGRVWKPNESMRHCFGTRAASELLGRGAAQQDVIRKIMATMGHTSHTTSMRYVELAVDSLRDILPSHRGH